MSEMPSWAKGLVAVIGALAAAIALVVSTGLFDDDCDEQCRPAVTQTVPIPAGVQMDADTNRDAEQVQESSAEPALAPGVAPSPELTLENVGPDIHEDMLDETPPGITEDEALEAHITPPNPLPADEEYEPQPQGGANDFTCRQNYVRNYSPRSTGVRTSMFVLHFTVSSPGSLRAIWNLFNTASFGASSHYLLELNGQCEQIVPFGSKAWTQGAFNSSAESVEIVTNNLTTNEWLAAPILRDATLAKMVVSRLKANGLPARLVDPAGCTPQAGVTDHNRLECGNSHWDVGPGFPWGKLMEDVRQIYAHGVLCNAACQRLERRKKAHRKTHAHYRRHAKAGECKRHPHKVKASELRKPHCRELKERIHRQHKGIRRAQRKVSA